MALEPKLLQKEIEAQLVAAGFSPAAANNAAQDGFWLAISTAIVTHIQSQAEVIVDRGDSAGAYKVL